MSTNSVLWFAAQQPCVESSQLELPCAVGGLPALKVDRLKRLKEGRAVRDSRKLVLRGRGVAKGG